MRDRVEAVAADGDTLTLELAPHRQGDVDRRRAFN